MKLRKVTIEIDVAQILADASNVEKGRQFSKLLRAMSCGEAKADDPAWVREAVGKAAALQRAHLRGAEAANKRRRGFCAKGTTPSDAHSVTQSDAHSVTQSVTHSDAHSVTHSVTQSDMQSDTHSVAHSVTQSDTHSVTHSVETPKKAENLTRAGSLLSENSKNLSISPLNSPPSSLPGIGEVGAGASEPSVATVRQMLQDRLSVLFRRRPTTRWNDAERKALGEIAKRPGVEEELAEIERLYRSGYKYRRKDIKTLLNNWTTELDRAAGYFGLREPKRSFEEQLEDA